MPPTKPPFNVKITAGLSLLIACCLFIACCCLLLTSLWANDEPFDGPALWGGTGLMEIPTARVLREGRYRVGVAQATPYRYYYGAISPLRGLEISGRVTEVLDVPALLAGYGNTKDKALDLKYQFLEESKWLPALALGIMDPHGTRIYPAQYLAASKQIYPFDFTIGFGNGRFGKRPLPSQGEGVAVEIFTDTSSWRTDGQFFAGVQFSPSEKLMLMAEYSPISYELQTPDPAQARYFNEPVPSKFNFGLRWRPLNWFETDLSWLRGEQFGANLSFAFDLGVPLIPLYDHPYKEMPEYRLHPWEERIARGLEAAGFRSVVIRRDDDALSVQAENVKYYYAPRALGVMLRVIAALAPAGVQKFSLIIANNGIPKVSLACSREDADLFAAEKLTSREFLSRAEMDTKTTDGLPGEKHHRQWWSYGLNPSLQTFLNDPSGFFKYRFGIRGWVSLYPWMGASLVTGLELYPLNTVSSSNTPLSEPVRSDIVPYQQNKAVLGILMGEQIRKFPREIYGRLAAGILEIQYAGLDGEMAMPLFGGRLMAGFSGSAVKKRDPDEVFGFKDNDFKSVYKTAFFNTRLNLPEIEAAIDLKTGQFLAGDRGTRLTLSKFFNGVILSAWYSVTDTSLFTDSDNRGYHDKGIAISIPLRLFRGTDSKTSYSFGISPWTRDVAQDIDHFTSLFDYMGRNTQLYLKKDALSKDGRGSQISEW